MPDTAHTEAPPNTLAPSFWSDLALWAVILLLAGSIGSYFLWFAPQQKTQQVSLNFRDANELTKGSIVRMMGTEIGFVNDIRIMGDHINVNIKTTPGSLDIPSGSTFTVNFTGLVGSKSIEVIPPPLAKPYLNGKPHYQVEEPIRLKDTLDYQTDIAQALQRGAENFSDFFGKKKPLEEMKYNVRVSNQKMVKANQILAKVNDTLITTERDTHQAVGSIANTAQNFELASREALETTNASDFGPNVYGIMRKLSGGIIEGRAWMARFNFENKLDKVNRGYLYAAGKMEQAKLVVDSTRLKTTLSKQEKNLGNFHHVISSMEAFFAVDRLPQIKQAQNAVQRFNRMILKFTGQVNQYQQTKPTPKA